MKYSFNDTHSLSEAQVKDKIFLIELCKTLNGCDLAGQNFMAFSPRCFSLVVDNYQIEINQTDVFYYPNAIHKILRFGDKRGFCEGDLERYEFRMFENEFPMHFQTSNKLMLGMHKNAQDSNELYRNSNLLMQCAAMATNRGFYKDPVFTDRPKHMRTMQNSHIFSELKNLWHIFKSQEDKVLAEPIKDETHYNIKPIIDLADAQKRGKLALYAIDKKLSRTK